MYGLIIKKQWIDHIVSGAKTLEIRGSKTSRINEEFYILESGSCKVRAICKIIAVYEIDENFWKTNKGRHCVEISYQDLIKRYSKPYAWELVCTKVINDDKFYKHPSGAVIWVKDVKILGEE